MAHEGPFKLHFNDGDPSSEWTPPGLRIYLLSLSVPASRQHKDRSGEPVTGLLGPGGLGRKELGACHTFSCSKQPGLQGDAQSQSDPLIKNKWRVRGHPQHRGRNQDSVGIAGLLGPVFGPDAGAPIQAWHWDIRGAQAEQLLSGRRRQLPPLEPGKRFVQTEAAPGIQGWATCRGLLGEWSKSLNFAVGDGKELQGDLGDLWRKRNLVAEEEGGGERCSSVILPHVLCTSTAGGQHSQVL
ncbi:unnamed protein product [Gadus morhua 'NCC']